LTGGMRNKRKSKREKSNASDRIVSVVLNPESGRMMCCPIHGEIKTSSHKVMRVAAKKKTFVIYPFGYPSGEDPPRIKKGADIKKPIWRFTYWCMGNWPKHEVYAYRINDKRPLRGQILKMTVGDAPKFYKPQEKPILVVDALLKRIWKKP
jgi:hypothetical protein